MSMFFIVISPLIKCYEICYCCHSYYKTTILQVLGHIYDGYGSCVPWWQIPSVCPVIDHIMSFQPAAEYRRQRPLHYIGFIYLESCPSIAVLLIKKQRPLTTFYINLISVICGMGDARYVNQAGLAYPSIPAYKSDAFYALEGDKVYLYALDGVCRTHVCIGIILEIKAVSKSIRKVWMKNVIRYV